jgi:hypothetical protein
MRDAYFHADLFFYSPHQQNIYTMAEKITKKKLLQEMDDKLQALNLLRSALEADAARKQEELESYKKQFYLLINKKK